LYLNSKNKRELGATDKAELIRLKRRGVDIKPGGYLAELRVGSKSLQPTPTDGFVEFRFAHCPILEERAGTLSTDDLRSTHSGDSGRVVLNIRLAQNGSSRDTHARFILDNYARGIRHERINPQTAVNWRIYREWCVNARTGSSFGPGDQ
jgi:hypothetical protein